MPDATASRIGAEGHLLDEAVRVLRGRADVVSQCGQPHAQRPRQHAGSLAGRGEAEQQQQVGGAEEGEEIRLRCPSQNMDEVSDPGPRHRARHVHGPVFRAGHDEAASRALIFEPRQGAERHVQALRPCHEAL